MPAHGAHTVYCALSLVCIPGFNSHTVFRFKQDCFADQRVQPEESRQLVSPESDHAVDTCVCNEQLQQKFDQLWALYRDARKVQVDANTALKASEVYLAKVAEDKALQDSELLTL